MKFKFLGTGGAFDYKIGHSSAMVNFNGRNILIDCGSTVYGRLRDLDLVEKIDDILITHLHGDHVGSLFLLIVHRRFMLTRETKTRVLYPTEAFRKHLYDFMVFSLVDPDKYVEFVPISEVEGIGYIDTFGKHVVGLPSFGYYFKDGDQLTYYSGDLGDVEITKSFLASRKESNIKLYHEMSFFESDVHVYYKDLLPLAQDYEMFAYHVNHHHRPADNKVTLVVDVPELLY